MGYRHPWFNDGYLLRFCRARKFELPKVIEMWSNLIQFRKQHDLDNILTRFDTEIKPKLNGSYDFYQRAVFGVDKLGRPIFITREGGLDVDGLMSYIDEEWYL